MRHGRIVSATIHQHVSRCNEQVQSHALFVNTRRLWPTENAKAVISSFFSKEGIFSDDFSAARHISFHSTRQREQTGMEKARVTMTRSVSRFISIKGKRQRIDADSDSFGGGNNGGRARGGGGIGYLSLTAQCRIVAGRNSIGHSDCTAFHSGAFTEFRAPTIQPLSHTKPSPSSPLPSLSLPPSSSYNWAARHAKIIPRGQMIGGEGRGGEGGNNR